MCRITPAGRSADSPCDSASVEVHVPDLRGFTGILFVRRPGNGGELRRPPRPHSERQGVPMRRKPLSWYAVSPRSIQPSVHRSGTQYE